MTALLILSVGALCIVCFVVGARVGQKVVKGEEIKLPNINPIEIIQEAQNKKQAQMEQDKIDTIMRNIEGYDGTGRGQEDVP
jgi:uncharacterized protein YneF (UPF0154 family)